MLDLTNPHQLIPLLQKHHLYTQKSFGQHFLINRRIIDQTLEAANIQPNDIIIEVGPGTGVLTRELAHRARQVITFEIDTKLQPLLAETLAEFSNIELHFQDFLKVNLEEVLSSQFSTNNQQPISYKFVANLPYNVGSHIIDLLIKSPNPPHSLTVLLQKEVAQKFVAQSPHATYLSNFIQTYGQAHIVATIPPSSFFPPPRVDSALLHLIQHQFSKVGQPTTNQELAVESQHSFSRFLHHGFSQPRKMLNKIFTKEELAQANINSNQRPENLTFQDWLQLYRNIHR